MSQTRPGPMVLASGTSWLWAKNFDRFADGLCEVVWRRRMFSWESIIPALPIFHFIFSEMVWRILERAAFIVLASAKARVAACSVVSHSSAYISVRKYRDVFPFRDDGRDTHHLDCCRSGHLEAHISFYHFE